MTSGAQFLSMIALSAALVMPGMNAVGQERNSSAAADVTSGTELKAELSSSLDSRTAKPGDTVVARVTKDVKSKGKKVVRKGDQLVGKVKSVESTANGAASTRVSVVFDTLVQGETSTELNTVLTSMVAVPRLAPMNSEPIFEPMSSPSPRSSGGGGLLGGGAGGSVLGSTTAAVGSTTSGTLGAVNNGALGTTTDATLGAATSATGNLNGLPTEGLAPLRSVRLDSVSSATGSAESTSVLQSPKGDFQLSAGTELKFRVAQDSSVGSSGSAQE